MKKIQLFLVMLFVSCLTAAAQGLTVTGKITYADDGSPVIGATVLVKGTNVAVLSDVNGAYKITIPASAAEKVLVFSFTGLVTKEIPITQSGSVDVALEAEMRAIEEVVVTVFGGTTPRKSFTGSAAIVDTKKIQDRPISNAAAALEGAAPGIQVNDSYGAAGSTPAVRIRGIGSVNASSSPLYVVDGVPYQGGIENINPSDIESFTVLKDASSTALYGNKAANGVIMITTKRGRTDSQVINVSISQGIKQRGIQEYNRAEAPLFHEAMWQSYKNGSLSNNVSGWTKENAGLKASQGLISEILKYNIYNVANDQLVDNSGKFNPTAKMLGTYGQDLDWYAPLTRLGYRQDYNVSITGGTRKTDYYASLGYLDETDYVIRSGFNRFSVRSNVNSQISSWLKAGVNVSGTFSNYESITGDSGNSSNYLNPFFFARMIAPIYPVFQHNGKTGEYVLDANGQKIWDFGTGSAANDIEARPQYQSRHVLAEIELDKSTSSRLAFSAQPYVDITFLKHFKFTAKGSLELTNNFYKEFNNALVGNGAGNGGRAMRNSTYNQTVSFQQLLNWGRSFDRHNVEVLVGHESYQWNYDYLYAFMSAQAVRGENYELINFLNKDQLTGYVNKYNTEGYLIRGKYNYDNKYFVEGSFRRDGSSKFEQSVRWGNFWSASGAWLITGEDFARDLDWLEMAKLRASYGQVGNDSGIGYYAYQPLYNLFSGGNSGNTALYKGSLGNSNLLWESSNQFDVALELSLFRRLNATIEYFDRESANLLFDVNLPVSGGSTVPIGSTSSPNPSITQNIGTMYNRGVELAINYDVISNGDWRWNVGLNFTTYVNKITKLPEQNRENGIISGTKRLFEGHGIYDYWLRDFAGVDPATGAALFPLDEKQYTYTETATVGDVTVNGVKYATNPSRGQYTWAGSAIPDFGGSFTSSLAWKGIDLSILLTYSVGGKVYDGSYASLMNATATASGIGAVHADIAGAWKNPGDITDIPRIDSFRNGWYNGTSTRWLTDGSYLNIRNVSLSYNLPKNVVKYLGANSARVYFSGDNIWYFNKRQGMDNQQSFAGTSNNSFTAPRTLTLGLRVSF